MKKNDNTHVHVHLYATLGNRVESTSEKLVAIGGVVSVALLIVGVVLYQMVPVLKGLWKAYFGN